MLRIRNFPISTLHAPCSPLKTRPVSSLASRSRKRNPNLRLSRLTLKKKRTNGKLQRRCACEVYAVVPSEGFIGKHSSIQPLKSRKPEVPSSINVILRKCERRPCLLCAQKGALTHNLEEQTERLCGVRPMRIVISKVMSRSASQFTKCASPTKVFSPVSSSSLSNS